LPTAALPAQERTLGGSQLDVVSAADGVDGSAHQTRKRNYFSVL
jgi:hypothetical protein